MGHRMPGTAGWKLAERGKKKWEKLISQYDETRNDEPNVFGWMNTGKIIISVVSSNILILFSFFWYV